MSWASLLKVGAKAATWVGKGAKATVETAGKAALHPQATIKGAGAAVKTAAVGAGLGYVGWQKLTTDESIVGIVSDAIIGEKGTQTVTDTVHGAVDGIRDLRDSVSGMTETVSSAVGNAEEKMNGISSFLGSVTSGQGGSMIGNFLGNLTHGNVSGLGIMGLVLSTFLLFGRFGWMGKIAGALMAMMMIGNNSQTINRQTKGATPVLQTTQEREIELPSQQEAESLHRSRR